MMKRISRITALLMAICICASLFAGCGGEVSDQTADGKTIINFWHHDGDDYDTDWWNYWIEAYNESQEDVVVNLTIVPGDAWDQKIKAAQATGTAPDMYDLPLSGVAQAAFVKTIMPLDDYVAPAVWNGLTDTGRKYSQLGGKYYCFPKYVEPSAMLLYRKDLFEEAGLDPEAPPKTWDELIEYGKKLTNSNTFGLGMPTSEGDMSWTTWGMQYDLSGGMAVTEDWSEARVANDGYVKLLTFFKDIFDSGIAPKQALGQGYADAATIAQGNVAMQMCGSWEIGALKEKYPDSLENIGVSFFPTPDGDYKRTTSTLGGWSAVIDAMSAHPQESADFLVYLFADKPERLFDYYKRGGWSKFSPWISVETMLANDPEASADPYRGIIAEQVVAYGVPEPLYAWNISISVGQAFNRVILEDEDPMTSLLQAEKEINDYIRKNNLAGNAY